MTVRPTRGCSGESFAHDVVFENRAAIVSDGDGASGFERGEVVSASPFDPRVAAAMGKTRTDAPAFGGLHPARELRRVIDGSRVGHGGDGGESAGGGGRGAGGDGFFVGLAGLAEMNVNVDEAGRDDQARGVEDFRAVFAFELAGGGDFGDATVFEKDVFGGVDACGGIDEMAVEEGERCHAAAFLCARRAMRAP